MQIAKFYFKEKYPLVGELEGYLFVGGPGVFLALFHWVSSRRGEPLYVTKLYGSGKSDNDKPFNLP